MAFPFLPVSEVLEVVRGTKKLVGKMLVSKLRGNGDASPSQWPPSNVKQKKTNLSLNVYLEMAVFRSGKFFALLCLLKKDASSLGFLLFFLFLKLCLSTSLLVCFPIL